MKTTVGGSKSSPVTIGTKTTATQESRATIATKTTTAQESPLTPDEGNIKIRKWKNISYITLRR